MAYIETVSPERATGPLKRLYDAALARAGRVWNVVRLMSLKPSTLEATLRLYQAVLFKPSPLSRATREMIAVVVSRANRCHY